MSSTEAAELLAARQGMTGRELIDRDLTAMRAVLRPRNFPLIDDIAPSPALPGIPAP